MKPTLDINIHEAEEQIDLLENRSEVPVLLFVIEEDFDSSICRELIQFQMDYLNLFLRFFYWNSYQFSISPLVVSYRHSLSVRLPLHIFVLFQYSYVPKVSIPFL